MLVHMTKKKKRRKAKPPGGSMPPLHTDPNAQLVPLGEGSEAGMFIMNEAGTLSSLGMDFSLINELREQAQSAPSNLLPLHAQPASVTIQTRGPGISMRHLNTVMGFEDNVPELGYTAAEAYADFTRLDAKLVAEFQSPDYNHNAAARLWDLLNKAEGRFIRAACVAFWADNEDERVSHAQIVENMDSLGEAFTAGTPMPWIKSYHGDLSYTKREWFTRTCDCSLREPTIKQSPTSFLARRLAEQPSWAVEGVRNVNSFMAKTMTSWPDEFASSDDWLTSYLGKYYGR